MTFWASFWDIIWWFLWAFAFVTYLFAVLAIIVDLFRDRSVSGWVKAVWLTFMVFVPLLTALVYLVARGEGMADRSYRASRAAREETEAYMRAVPGNSPSEDIAKAKVLLDQGVVTQEEYEHLKAEALGRVRPSAHPVH
ncbi:SHOCT domain-containing protein [Georgenia sp. SYP-B2076]|uniref:SHOCT domain-containing protein n=1 Tax=Georgenia sp. SYP-B2076 TaxID=2495881 RepID=UPI000F8D74D3|nr:SHOCT domain-containing protein [Georgenia sp. SYP-B2076]